jgi:hypothetical protein
VLVTFYHDMIDSVSRWEAAKASDVNVVANLPHLMQYCSEGLSPYMVGIPLISQVSAVPKGPKGGRRRPC